MSITALTFEQLKKTMIQRINRPGMPTQASLPNLLSALDQFTRQRGLMMSEPVGSVLRLSYHAVLESHLTDLRAEGRPGAYLSNRKNLLSHWHRLVLALDREDSAHGRCQTPLQTALRQLVAGGIKIKALARASGVPLSNLRRWLAGARPQRAAVSDLRKIERYLGMVQGTLTDLVTAQYRPNASEKRTSSIEYRKVLARLCVDHYRLKPACALEAFRAEWKALVRFKSSAFASVCGLLEDRSGSKRRWRLLPNGSARPSAHSWVGTVDGRRCPSAELSFGLVAQFIGWLELDLARGGVGLPSAQAQILGLLCDRARLASFVQWRVERSGGAVNGGSSRLLRLVSTLCHPQHGFFVQKPEIGIRAGISERAAWLVRCADVRAFAVTAIDNLDSQQQPFRDPFEPIQSILVLDNPVDAITDAVRRLDADRPITGGIGEAIWARDRLLLTLSASNPLRARNLRELTYRNDNTGHLRRDQDGTWRIVIPKDAFKNFAGAANDRRYDMRVQESLWPHIERYLRDYRPLLAAPGTDLVFVSSTDGGREWTKLNRRYEILARKYIHNSPGFGPHSIRHIVATGILKRSGNVSAAALILHDREKTVREHYAHLLADDGARWLDEHLGDAFRRM